MGHFRALQERSLSSLVDSILAGFSGTDLLPEAARPVPFKRIYLDTADGLFDQAGLLLVHETSDGGRLSLIEAPTNMRLVTLAIPSCPRFLTALPSGPFRDRIAQIAGVRALLPQASVGGRGIAITVRNATDKTVLRLQLSEGKFGGRPHSRHHALGVRLELEPVRGYDAEAKSAAAILSALPQFGYVATSLPDFIWAALGSRPGGAFPRGPVLFSPDIPATVANRLLLSRLLTILEVNEAGMVADIDSEFLHDFRVALRRARSLMSCMKNFLSPGFLSLGEDLRWLGEVTGPARDLDVYLLDFHKLATTLPVDERPGLLPMRGLLQKKRKAAYAALHRALQSERYQRLKIQWYDALGHDDSSPDVTSPPILQVAGKRIVRIYRRALKEGRAITKDSPPEHLHTLRKTCKKLRYLIEFYQHLFPEMPLREHVRNLKRLQNTLGTYQDAQIQKLMVDELLRELEAQGPVTSATRQAMQHLAAGRVTLQDRARKHFAESFASFALPEAGKKGQDVYKQIFGLSGDGLGARPVPEGGTE